MRGVNLNLKLDPALARRAWLRRAGAAPQPWARAGPRPERAAARRLVSVGGALTEIVYALEAQAELVGVDSTSQYPVAAQRLPSVGYARSLSLEGVLALAPTQVLATEDAGPPAVLRQLVPPACRWRCWPPATASRACASACSAWAS
jgi:iron complex transport system substrate-binding protein